MGIPRAGTKVGSSDPLFLFGRGSDHKLSYNRDNRVIFLSSSYLWKCLPPRCWINLSWRCSRFQGLVCSTIKKLHDLSLQRREAAEFLSTLRYLNYGIEFDCTQGPQIRLLWCICCLFWHRRVATSLRIKAECISSLKPYPFLSLFGLAVDYGVLGSTFSFRKVFA